MLLLSSLKHPHTISAPAPSPPSRFRGIAAAKWERQTKSRGGGANKWRLFLVRLKIVEFLEVKWIKMKEKKKKGQEKKSLEEQHVWLSCEMGIFWGSSVMPSPCFYPPKMDIDLMVLFYHSLPRRTAAVPGVFLVLPLEYNIFHLLPRLFFFFFRAPSIAPRWSSRIALFLAIKFHPLCHFIGISVRIGNKSAFFSHLRFGSGNKRVWKRMWN